MKKTIATLVLGAALLVGGMGTAFAINQEVTDQNTTFGRGFGPGYMYSQNLSVEDLLEQKLAFIDKLVEEGKITEEQGESYKAMITERMSNCNVVGENRDENERLGLGFGRGNGFGNGRGMGKGMGFGRGFSNNQ